MAHKVKYNNGDFVTATVRSPDGVGNCVRQGVAGRDRLTGELKLYGESDSVYELVEVYHVVEGLRGSTLRFVEKWREDNAEVHC